MNNDTLKGGVKKAEGTMEKAYGQATNNPEHEASGTAKKLMGDAQMDLGKAKEKAERAAERAAEDLTISANRAGRKVRDVLDNAGDELSVVADKLTHEIEQNPMRSSLIALGLGFVIGALLNR